MKKGAFAGWQDVFAFTWKQAVNGKGFKGATIGIAFLFLIVGLAISTLMAFFQKQDGEVSPISQVAIVDESGLDILYLDGFKETYGEKYPDVTFVESSEDVSLTVKITNNEE